MTTCVVKRMPTIKRKKNITLDDLAMMVARGFEAQDKKFTKRFDAHDKRFDAHDKRFDAHDKRMDMLDQRIDLFEVRFNQKIENLDKKFDKKFDMVMNSIDKLTKLLEIYHHEQMAMAARMDRHEEWIKQIAERVGVQLKY